MIKLTVQETALLSQLAQIYTEGSAPNKFLSALHAIIESRQAKGEGWQMCNEIARLLFSYFTLAIANSAAEEKRKQVGKFSALYASMLGDADFLPAEFAQAQAFLVARVWEATPEAYQASQAKYIQEGLAALLPTENESVMSCFLFDSLTLCVNTGMFYGDYAEIAQDILLRINNIGQDKVQAYVSNTTAYPYFMR